jgi:hypothetical protein
VRSSRPPRERRLPRARLARLPLLGLLLLPLLGTAGCASPVEEAPAAAVAADLPASAEELEAYVVPSVPSGLPRLPDAQLSPPAGAQTLEDVASYAPDPGHERGVLEDYGYRFGWERIWGHDGGPMTSVFVDQFETSDGAAQYASDLAANEAEHYDEELSAHAPHLPGGCRMLTVAEPRPSAGLTDPSVFAWCGHGVFSVGVTSVASSVEAAIDEVRAVLGAQLERLPS